MRRLHDILPYEPGYTHHRDIERQRREARAWLRRREAVLKQALRPSAPPEAEAKRS